MGAIESLLDEQKPAAKAKPEKEPGPISLFGRGLAHGGLTFAESIGSGVQWLGNRLRSEDVAQAGEGWANYWREKADAYGPPPELEGKNVIDNPEILGKASFWVYNVADMIPSLGVSIVPAFGWLKGVQAYGKAKGLIKVLESGQEVALPIINRLAKLGSWVIGGATGGSIEAAQTYKTLLDDGVDEAEAARSAEMMFLMAGALNAIGTGTILEKAGKTFIGKVAKHAGSAVAEGLTEGAEEPAEVISKYIGKYLSGESLPDNLKSDLLDSLKDAATVFPIAALTGGGASMITSRKSQSDEMGNQDSEVRKILDEARQGKKNVDQSVGQEAPDTGTPSMPTNPLPVDEGLIERVPVEPQEELPTAGAVAQPSELTQAAPAPAPEAEPTVTVPTLPTLDEYLKISPGQMDAKIDEFENFAKETTAMAKTESERIRKEIASLKGKEDEASVAKVKELKETLKTLDPVNIKAKIEEKLDKLLGQVETHVKAQLGDMPAEQKQKVWDAFRSEWDNEASKGKSHEEILKTVIPVAQMKEVTPSEAETKAEAVLEQPTETLQDKLKSGAKALTGAKKKPKPKKESGAVLEVKLAGPEEVAENTMRLVNAPEGAVLRYGDAYGWHKKNGKWFGTGAQDGLPAQMLAQAISDSSKKATEFTEKLKAGAKATTGAKGKKAKPEPTTVETPIENAPVDLQILALTVAKKTAKARKIKFELLGPESVVHTPFSFLTKKYKKLYPEGVHVRLTKEGYEAYAAKRVKQADQAKKLKEAPPKTLRSFIHKIGGLAPDDPVYGQLIKDRLMSKKGWQPGSFNNRANGGNTLSEAFSKFQQEYPVEAKLIEGGEAGLIRALEENPPLGKGVEQSEDSKIEEQNKKETKDYFTEEENAMPAAMLIAQKKFADIGEAYAFLEKRYGKEWYWNKKFDRDLAKAEEETPDVAGDEEKGGLTPEQEEALIKKAEEEDPWLFEPEEKPVEPAKEEEKPAEEAKPEAKKEEPEPSELQELRKQILVLQNEPMRTVSKMFKTPAAIAQMTGDERKEAQKKFDRMVAVETKRLQPEIDKLQAKIDEILAKPEPETGRLFGEEETGKPIWKMTHQEYMYSAFPKLKPENIGPSIFKPTKETHRAAVKQALEEGKPVPANVLDDYPDLKPKEPAQKSLLAPKKEAEKSVFDFADELDNLIEEEEPGKRKMAETSADERNYQEIAKALESRFKESGTTIEKFIEGVGSKLSPRVATYFERWANEKTGQGKNAGTVQPAGGRGEAPAGGDGEAPSGGPVGRGVRPGLRVAGREFLPRPGNYVDVGRYPILGGDQRFAANAIVQAHEDGKRGFLYASGVGTGKTIGQLVAGNIIAEKTKGKVLFVTQNQAIVDTRYIPDAREKLGIDLTDKGKFELGTYDELRTGKIGKGEYEAVFYDECFPAGTKVATPDGYRAIEKIKTGDTVRTPFGNKKVLKVFRRTRTRKLIKIEHENGSLVCTGNHRIYSARKGLKLAENLLDNRDSLIYDTTHGTIKEMRELRQGVLPREQKGTLPRDLVVVEKQPFLQPFLPIYGYLEKRCLQKKNVRRNEASSNYRYANKKSDYKANDGKQSFEISRDAEASERHFKGQTISRNAGRKWKTFSKSAVASIRETWRSLEDRVSALGEAKGSNLAYYGLGYCPPEPQVVGGMRWRGPQKSQSKAERRIERETPLRNRMDYYSILEQGNLEESLFGRPEDTFSPVRSIQPFGNTEITYDLEVEDAHCYYAEGVLVSNSHNLANVEAQRTIASEKVLSKFKVYASATPGDQPVKFSVFMSKITGVPEETIHKALGFEVQWYEDPHTHDQKPRTVLLQGMSWKKVMDNVVDYRNQAIKNGTFYRAELPFWGNLDVKRMYLTTDMEEEQNSIKGYWAQRLLYAKNKMKVAGERAQELRRWIELKKVGPIYDAAMKALAEGKKVVVVAEGVNATGVKGLGIEKGEYKAFIQAFEDRLKREGAVKDWAKIYGSRDKTKEVDRFQKGQTDLAIMTPQSGGAGIDLDDIVGTKPRAVFVANVNYSADVFEQVTGRFSRKNTKTPTDIQFYFFEGAEGDKRSWEIIDRKVQTVKAIQRGIADLDKAIGMTVTDQVGQPRSLVFINQDGQRAEPFTEKPVRSRIEQIRAELETDAIPAIKDIELEFLDRMEKGKDTMHTLPAAKAESLLNMLKLSKITQDMKAGKKPIAAFIETPAKGVYQFRRPYGWFVYREGGIVEVKDRREMAEGGKAQRTPDTMLDLIRSIQPVGQPRALVSIGELRDKATTWPYDEFDQTLLQLARDGKIALHHHDFAASLSDSERKRLVSIEDKNAYWGGRTYFVGVVPKEEVKPVAKPQVQIIVPSQHPELKKAIDVGNGVMVTTALKDPTADAKAKEIVNANKDVLSQFAEVVNRLKGLLEASGFKDIPSMFVTVDPNIRGYVPDDQRMDTPVFLNPYGLSTSIEEKAHYKRNAKRMGENRARAHGLIQAMIHEYAEYLTRNSPTLHGDDLIRMMAEINDSIDPKDYVALHDHISEAFYGKYLSRIQSAGKALSDLATKGSKLFGNSFPGSGGRRELGEAATANRGNRESALIRGGTFDSGLVEALPDTIYNKAMVDNVLFRQSGKPLSKDLQENRTFIMQLFELADPAIEAARSIHRKLQTEIQSLAGPKSKRRFSLGFAYQPKYKRSEQSDILDEAIRIYIDSGGEQAGPIFAKFKDEATRQLNDPDQYLKDKGITDKEALGRYEAIKSKDHQRELRHWLKVIEAAEKLTPQQKEFAEKMRDMFEDAGMVAKEHGYLKSFVDNYVRRIYKFKPWESEGLDSLGGHGFRLRFGPNQQRSYKFMADAVLDGYQVGIKGVTNSWLSYMEELATTIANNTFKKIGMKTVDISGNKMFTTKQRNGNAPLEGMFVWEWAGDVVAEKELEGDEVLTVDDYGKKFFVTTPTEIPEYWAVYKSEDAARASRKFLDKEEALEWARSKGYTRIERRRPMDRSEIFEKRQIYAPAPLAEMFNKVTATDELFFKAPFMSALLRWNMGVKTWVLMSSFFHHMAGARSWLFAVHHGWKPENLNLVSAYKRGLDKIAERDPLLMFGVKNGLQLGSEGEFQERILAGKKGITEALASKLGLDRTLEVVGRFKRTRENFTNSLFKSFFSGLVAEAFCIEYTHELNRLNTLYNQGKLKEAPNPDRVAEKVALLINYDFGGLPYKRMGRNPTLQKMSRLALLAPDWTESNFRIVTGMIPGLNTTINKMIGDLPEVPGMDEMARKFFGRSMLRIAILTILAQMLLNGSDESEDFIEEQMLSNRFSRFRWTEVDITKLYNMLGIDTEEQRKTFSIGGHFFDPLKLIDPFKLAKSKGSPLTRVIEAVSSGSDWAERPYTGTKELITTGKTTKKSYHQQKEGGIDRLPSVVVNQIVNMQPIQLGHLIKYAQGEEDGLSALAMSAGAAVHTAWGPRIETPIAKSKAGKDVAMDAIEELQSDGALKAAPPSRYVTINQKSYQMTPSQYKEFFEKSSDMARPRLERLVESEGFNRLTPDKKAQIIERIIGNARRKARLKVKREMLQQLREGTLKEAA